mmetsp:Transcript_59274/g.67471  ORF Transcript_59274/g.67471 Transcript_59274/m.67471 type:complete len:206 (+) Transcript_59274:35-652(+)
METPNSISPEDNAENEEVHTAAPEEVELGKLSEKLKLLGFEENYDSVRFLKFQKGVEIVINSCCEEFQITRLRQALKLTGQIKDSTRLEEILCQLKEHFTINLRKQLSRLYQKYSLNDVLNEIDRQTREKEIQSLVVEKTSLALSEHKTEELRLRQNAMVRRRCVELLQDQIRQQEQRNHLLANKVKMNFEAIERARESTLARKM